MIGGKEKSFVFLFDHCETETESYHTFNTSTFSRHLSQCFAKNKEYFSKVRKREKKFMYFT